MRSSNHPRKEVSRRWRDLSVRAGLALSCAAQDDTAMRHRAAQVCRNQIVNCFQQIEL
jgi:hypothetical protein